MGLVPFLNGNTFYFNFKVIIKDWADADVNLIHMIGERDWLSIEQNHTSPGRTQSALPKGSVRLSPFQV